MTKQNGNFTIKELERANNSVYGNPAYYVTAETENGATVTGKTASNAQIGYLLCGSYIGKTVKLSYHYTKSGNLIFDYMQA